MDEMNTTSSNKTTDLMASPWLIEARRNRHPLQEVEGQHATQVAIAGAGFAGVFTAVALAQAGIHTILVDREFPGSGISALAGGFGCSAGDDMDSELAKIYGLRFTKSQRTGKRRAQKWLLKTLDALHVEKQCNLIRVPSYFAGYGEDDATLVEEYELLAKIDANIELVNGEECGHSSVTKAIRYGDEFGLNGLGVITALLDTPLAKQFITVLRGDVVGVDDGHVHTKGGVITADYVVLATGRGHDKFCPGFPEIAMESTSFAITYQYDGEPPLGRGNFWNSHDGSYSACEWYRRLPGEDDRTVLIGGSPIDRAPWDITDLVTPFEALHDFQKEYLAGAGHETARWFGGCLVSKDTLPYAGIVPGRERLLAIAALGGSGIVHASVCALIVRDIVRQHHSQYGRIFGFDRERKFTGVGEELWAAHQKAVA